VSPKNRAAINPNTINKAISAHFTGVISRLEWNGGGLWEFIWGPLDQSSAMFTHRSDSGGDKSGRIMKSTSRMNQSLTL